MCVFGVLFGWSVSFEEMAHKNKCGNVPHVSVSIFEKLSRQFSRNCVKVARYRRNSVSFCTRNFAIIPQFTGLFQWERDRRVFGIFG